MVAPWGGGVYRNSWATMKKSIVGLVAIGALTAPAMGADLGPPVPMKASPAPIAPGFSWTGFYIGANLGGSWANVPESFNVPPVFGATFNLTNKATSTSIIGGGQVGYNYQINFLVLGVEADFDDRRNKNDFSCFVTSAVSATGCTNVPPSLLTLHDEQNWLGTVRGRLGVAFDHLLLYGTGGLAYGNVKHSLIENQVGFPGAILTVSDNATRTGWAAGVGAEWAINDNWSLGVEYLHVDLGSTTLNTPSPPVMLGGVTFFPSNATFTDRSDIVRARIDYRFNWGGPIATNY